MSEDVRPSNTKGKSTGSRSARHDRGMHLGDMLSGIGISDEKISGVKSYVASAVEKKVRDLDAGDTMDRVLEVASRIGGTLRDNARKNPALFFGGLTATVLGIGMMLTAGRDREVAKKRKLERGDGY